MTVDVPGSDVILNIEGLRKRFGRAEVLKGVDIQIRRGEILGLMGPNGAGKSTLIKIISGVHESDGGRITLAGERVSNLRGRREIGIVHQDLGLVDSLPVFDNLRLGSSPARSIGPFVSRIEEMRAAQAALKLVGMDDIPLHITVGELSVGQKAMIAIARLLEKGARLIILDETTATMNRSESRWLFYHLRTNAAGGAAVLFVSHKLGEVREVCDRAVLLVDGEVAADAPIAEFLDSGSEMIGAATVHRQVRSAWAEFSSEDAVITLEGAGTATVEDVSLHVRAGACVGLVGSVNSGIHEIAFMASGAVQPSSGRVKRTKFKRVALVPPQREVQAVLGDASVLWNASLTTLKDLRISRTPFLSLMRERQRAQAALDRLSVAPRDLDSPITALSGGNQQKVIFARAMLQGADAFVLCEPTRGVDVRTRREIYALINDLRASGKAILVASSDVEDVLATSDVVHFVENGKLGPELAAASDNLRSAIDLM